MKGLAHSIVRAKRALRATYGFVAAISFGALVLLRTFTRVPGSTTPLNTSAQIEFAVLACAWIGVFTARLIARTKEHDAAERKSTDLELGLLLLVAAHAVAQYAAPYGTPMYALVYVVVAFTTAFARPPMGMIFLGMSVALEANVHMMLDTQGDWRTLPVRIALLLVFGALHFAFTQAEITRVRLQSRRELNEERERQQRDARLYRLVRAKSDTDDRDEDRIARASVAEVRETGFYVLDLLKRTLDAQTCVLLLRDNEDTDKLMIAECASDSEDLVADRLSLTEGAVGAVAHRGLMTNLSPIRDGYRGLTYYRNATNVRSFLGVPVVENGVLRGALCIDRVEEKAFTLREQNLVERAVHQLLRAMQNERVFVQLEQAKHEQTILHRASKMLGEALSESAVLDAGLTAVAQIIQYDIAAVTSYDAFTHKHSVTSARGVGAEELQGVSFRENASLVSMAVKNRHYLPYRGERDTNHVVFTKKEPLKGMQSLLVLPLIVREEVIGTLVLGSERASLFTDQVRQTVAVVANQLAVSLANAASVRQLEELATTDGLTGCLNKRAFLLEFDRRLRAAERFKKKLSLIITDIDHFKAVNDVYGHATGDIVIRELGALLRRAKRDTDLVARFGGEEFCILCEETDTTGAIQFAERIRVDLEKRAFHTDMGQLNVTCSLGVATFPEHAADQTQLFEVADRALYAAKGNGRNQVRVCGDSARPKTAAA